MKYVYTAAWAVVGGISLREEGSPVVLASSESTRFILTRDPDPHLARVDEGSAIAMIIGKVFIGQGRPEDFQTELETEVEKLKADRRKKTVAKAVLLFQAQGEIEASVQESLQEYDTFIVCFDVIEKNIVRQLHKTDIEAMKVAVTLESDWSSSFAYLAEGTYLLNDAGKPVYSISVSFSGEPSVYTPLSEEAATRIAGRYAVLNQESDLESVVRLFSQMAEFGTDRLKAFLSGWAALEILIAKSFKSYEQAFFSPFTNAEHPTLRERFLKSIKAVMKDKYRLKDKFIAVTAVLFPNIEDDEAESNYADFCKLKKRRDLIFHGEPFSEKDLPLHELASLLRKYLIARITMPNNALNTASPPSDAAVR